MYIFYASSFGLQHLAKTSTEELGLFMIPESASALQVPKVTTAPQPVAKVAKVPKVANLNKARSGCGAGVWYAKGIWLERLATHSLHHANTVYPLLLGADSLMQEVGGTKFNKCDATGATSTVEKLWETTSSHPKCC